MDNEKRIINTQEIKLLNREHLNINGVEKLYDFNKEEFNIGSNYGNIVIKGKNLELIILDLNNSNMQIKGKINCIIYNDTNNKESIIQKLFK